LLLALFSWAVLGYYLPRLSALVRRNGWFIVTSGRIFERGAEKNEANQG